MELVFLVVLIGLMILALSSGFPVAFALPGSAIGAIALAAACGYLFAGDASAYFAQDGPVQWLTAGITNFRSLYWEVERDTLIAIPLFVFMGIMLERSRIAEDLLVAMAQLFGPVPGGLGISVVFVGALLAATTGILGATVIAMGLISLPAMLRNNYSRPLATGTICASGTLGQIIPPSIVLIILADQLANAADQARTLRASEYRESTGEFSMPAELDISSASAGDMFMGALIPGLILVGLYMLYILVRAILKPEVAPPVPYDGKYDRRFVAGIALSLVPPLALIFAVLGSIVLGIATVNQAGAIGAVGAIVMGGYRLAGDLSHRYTPLAIIIASVCVILVLNGAFDLNVKNITSRQDFIAIIIAAVAVTGCVAAIAWSTWRTFTINNTLVSVMIDTAKTTSMVFIILIGAAMLTAAFRGFGGEHLVREFLTGLPGGFWTQFLVVMLVIFLLGFFLDFIEIAVVVVPIVAPILLSDPAANVTAVWLGVMIGLNIQTSFLTPPFGFALFYLRGVAPPEVKTTHIYKGATAFIALQLLGLAIAGYFPGLVNYMPNRTYLTSDNAPPPVNPRLQLCIEERVFEEYAAARQPILEGINAAASTDYSALPAAWREPLEQSFALAGDTFDLVDRVMRAEDDKAAYEVEFTPVHRVARYQKNRLRFIADRLEVQERRRNRLARDPGTTREQLQDMDLEIARLEREREELINNAPDDWDTHKARYDELTTALSAAQTAYRRNVDDAYRPVRELLRVLGDTNALAEFRPELERLGEALRGDAGAGALIERIQAMESQLSEINGAGDIRSALSRARRALRADVPDFTLATEHHDQAMANFDQEIQWRNNAGPVHTALRQYDQVIRGNIGIRMQERLTRDQAVDVAACLSDHRDVSLRF